MNQVAGVNRTIPEQQAAVLPGKRDLKETDFAGLIAARLSEGGKPQEMPETNVSAKREGPQDAGKQKNAAESKGDEHDPDSVSAESEHLPASVLVQAMTSWISTSAGQQQQEMIPETIASTEAGLEPVSELVSELVSGSEGVQAASGESVQETAFLSATKDMPEPESPQTAEAILEPGSPQAAKVMPEDNPDLSKSDRIPETPEDLNTRSHLMETKVTVSGESVQETAFPSVTEDISEPESPQTAEVMSEPGHPQAAKVMPVPEDKPEVPDSGRIPETPEDLNIRSHLMEAKATASGETGKKETELSAAREIPEPEIKPVVQEAQDTMIAQPHLTGKFARAGQREDIRAESGDKAVLSGIVNAQRSSSSENNLAAMGEEPVKDTVLRTSRSGMADDLTAFMSKHLTGQNGSFHITLEPANLGTIHMELTYRSGEASLVIRATDPETLKLLNEHAERMGQILRENTGTETIVRVSQPDSGEKAGHPSGDTTDTEARSQNRREADENRGQSRKRENRTNAFLNMMRLGMV